MKPQKDASKNKKPRQEQSYSSDDESATYSGVLGKRTINESSLD